MGSFLTNPLFDAVLGFAIPILLLPFLMRFIVSAIVLAVAKKKYLPGCIASIKAGYETPLDKQAIEEVIAFAEKKLKRFFAFRVNLAKDGEDLLVKIKNVFDPDSHREKLRFPFSLKKLSEAIFLAFEDIYRDYWNTPWFRIIRNTRVVWFQRFTRVKRLWDLFFSFPLFEQLRRTRVIWRIVRLFLIPLLGIPFLVWYVLRSVFTSVFLEGAFRLFYALLILKAGYYAVYAFGRDNKVIRKHVSQVHGKKLKAAYIEAEKAIDPRTWNTWSDRLGSAISAYQQFLSKAGIEEDLSFSTKNEGTSRRLKKMTKKILVSIATAYSKKNPFKKTKPSILDELRALVLTVSAEYRPGAKNPLLYLRLGELLEAGYIASSIVFYKIDKTPGVNLLLDKVSVELVLNVTTFVGREDVAKNLKQAKKLYDSYRLLSIAYRIFSVIRGIAAPISLVISASSPIVLQQIQDLVKANLFHIAGRLTLATWEADVFRKRLLR